MRIILKLLISILFINCNSVDGKIEQRGNLIFLVNTSTSKKYRFTVKRTEVQDGKIHRYRTEFYELQPGEEMHIGEDTSFIPAKHPFKQREVIRFEKIPTKAELLAAEKERRTYKEEDTRKNDPFASRGERRKFSTKKKIYTPVGATFSRIPKNSKNWVNVPVRDTIINGKKMNYYFTAENYYDKKVTIPSKSYKYKYEVKGQVEIKQ